MDPLSHACASLFLLGMARQLTVFVWVRSVAAIAAETDVFTSPEVAKSFDFSNEERIYKW